MKSLDKMNYKGYTDRLSDLGLQSEGFASAS